MQLKAIQAQLVKTKIIPDWMEVKIIKFCDKYHLDQNSVDLIKQRLITGDLVTICQFMKEPLKQNFSEKYLFNHLKNHCRITKLAPNGVNAYYLIDHQIQTNLKSKPIGLKSLDFKIIINQQTYFLVHKLINESGGTQDQQFNEIVNLIKGLDKNSAKQIIFVCDGEYFHATKIAKLTNLVDFKIHIYTTLDLQAQLELLGELT